eukprot:Gb_12850 [translate_table: standard]
MLENLPHDGTYYVYGIVLLYSVCVIPSLIVYTNLIFNGNHFMGHSTEIQAFPHANSKSLGILHLLVALELVQCLEHVQAMLRHWVFSSRACTCSSSCTASHACRSLSFSSCGFGLRPSHIVKAKQKQEKIMQQQWEVRPIQKGAYGEKEAKKNPTYQVKGDTISYNSLEDNVQNLLEALEQCTKVLQLV